MSIGFRDQKEARRRKWRVIRWLVTLAVFVAIGAYSYRGGVELARLDASRLQSEVERLTGEVAALTETRTSLEQELEATRQSEAEWRKRYETEVPTGKLRELLDLMAAQVAKGAKPARIEQMLQVAAEERNCDPVPVTKRFYVHTPFYAGPIPAAGFADNALTVAVRGTPAISPEGNPEGWFDPGKPVQATIAEVGGRSKELEGPLPLNHTLVRGDREYRIGIVPSERTGFVNIVVEGCAFP